MVDRLPESDLLMETLTYWIDIIENVDAATFQAGEDSSSCFCHVSALRESF